MFNAGDKVECIDGNDMANLYENQIYTIIGVSNHPSLGDVCDVKSFDGRVLKDKWQRRFKLVQSGQIIDPNCKCQINRNPNYYYQIPKDFYKATYNFQGLVDYVEETCKSNNRIEEDLRKLTNNQ